MNERLPSRDEAWQLLCQYTEKEGLRKHALAVEASMRHYARLYGEDEELWGLTGLLHDFDYEKWPDEQNHPFRGVEILASQGYPDVMRTAILGHAPYSGVPRETRLAKALYACDELAGFVTACALVRPGRAIAGLDAGSVRKKLKDKGFARTVNRDDVYRGALELRVDLDEHITFVIGALTGVAPELGLG